MADSMRRSQRHFHETPLVFFTVLGVAGGGLGSAHLLRMVFGGAPLALSFGEGSLLSSLLLLGMVFSMGHLGKPLRGPYALLGVGRSPLSNEILALGVAVAAGVVGLGAGFFVPGNSTLLGLLGLLASLASVAFLLALGALYSLPGQPGWQGPVVVQPLLLGSAWGLLMGPLVVPSPPGAELHLLLVGFLTLDAGLALLRFRGAGASRKVGALLYPRLVPWGRRLLSLRILLSAVLTPFAIFFHWWWLSALALSLALVLDRVVFYTLAARVTTESEVARVEALL